MKNELICTKCKSKKVRLVDNEPLEMTESTPITAPEFDSELYARFECDDCGHDFPHLLNIVDPAQQEKSAYSLNEAVADIAFRAGEKKYYSGNSREDMDNFIEWAKEFEALNHDAEWGVNTENDYIDEVLAFADAKMNKKEVWPARLIDEIEMDEDNNTYSG